MMRPFDDPIAAVVVIFAVWFIWRGIKNRNAHLPLMRHDTTAAAE